VKTFVQNEALDYNYIPGDISTQIKIRSVISQEYKIGHINTLTQ
jgi:hypothetical protein